MNGVRTICVVLLLLLAGCGGTSDPTPTTTPAPVPDSNATAALPPGVAADSVNATELADAHQRAVENRSYILVIVNRRRVGGQELGARFTGTRQVIRVAGDRYLSEEAALSARAAFSATVVERIVFSDGSERYIRAETENGTIYRVVPDDPGRFAALSARMIAHHLAVENVSVSPTVDGGAEIRGSSPTEVNASYYTVEARVGPDGFVTELRANYRDAEGTPQWVTLKYRRVGNTSVERPEWMDDAVTNATVTETRTSTPASSTPGRIQSSPRMTRCVIRSGSSTSSASSAVR